MPAPSKPQSSGKAKSPGKAKLSAKTKPAAQAQPPAGEPIAAAPQFNTLQRADCIQAMQALPAGSVDLVFADPPFNIGYDYDVYNDRQEHDDYLAWSRRWIEAVHRVLQPAGTFWLAIGDEYAAELKLCSQEIGFHSRSWVVWYYTFGVNCKSKFTRSHAHLFYFVKDAEQFTFRSEELDNRIPSARQLVYADTRANPVGRLADDTWVLRPQDLADCFTTAEDTWYFPRVAGTFKERAGFHGCQMPEQLLGRIIRICSHPGDVVLDPFSGSATTLSVAKKLGRRYVGFDLSAEYVERGQARLKSICVGDPLDGAAEPTMSAPATPKQKGAKGKLAKAPVGPHSPAEQAAAAADAARQAAALEHGLVEAFRRSHDGFSLDRLVADPELNARFAAACDALGLPGEARTWNWTLFSLRKAGRFAEFPTRERTEFSWEACDGYLFASEIAWRQMIDRGCESLDHILCDPAAAAEFDQVARRWAPGYSSLQYRWAAMKLRKTAKIIRSRASLLTDGHLQAQETLDRPGTRRVPEAAGVYFVHAPDSTPVYAGEAKNLRQRLASQFSKETRPLWQDWAEPLQVRYFATDSPATTRLGYQRRLIIKHQPLLNLPEAAV